RPAAHFDDLTPGPEPAQVDEVRPDRAQDAAPSRSIVPPAPGSIERLRPPVTAQIGPEHELEMENRADGAHLDQLPHLAPIGLVTQLVVDAGQPAAPLRDLEHLLRLPDRERHRLLAQHVLPRLQRRDRVARVGIGRRGYDDEVDLRSAGERFTALECVGNTELRRDGAGALHAPARDRRHRDTRPPPSEPAPPPRTQINTPSPSLHPGSTRPLRGPPLQWCARAGASNRIVSLGGRATRARTRPACSGALPHAPPSRASGRAT